MNNYTDTFYQSMFDNIKKDYKDMLDAICNYLYQGLYGEAETLLLELVKKIYYVYESPQAHTGDEVFVSEVIYVEFNKYYEYWLAQHGHTGSNNTSSLHTEEHDNVLIDKCTDPGSIDDLMWDLNNLLTANPDNYVTDDITYHLDCYNRTLKAHKSV